MCTGLRTRRRAEGWLIVRSALAGALALSVASAGFSDTVPSPVKARGSDSLFQIRNGERWGYMDRNGQTIIPPRFDREGDFFGGRALCLARPASQSAADRNMDERSLKAFLHVYLRGRPGSDEKTSKYSHAWVGLHGAGKRDAIVYLQGKGWCGSGGCVTLVVSPKESTFRVVTWITLAQLPIRVLADTANGWDSLGIWVQGGGVQPGYEAKLRFDGNSYPTNPSAPPAIRLGRGAVGEAVIIPSSAVAALYP